MFNVQSRRELVHQCADLGVSSNTMEMVMCAALARYELVPQQIEIIMTAPHDDANALRKIAVIKGIVEATDRNADRRDAIFGFKDPTRTPREIHGALGAMTDHFEEGAPAARRKLRAKLGVPLERIKGETLTTVERERLRRKKREAAERGRLAMKRMTPAERKLFREEGRKATELERLRSRQEDAKRSAIGYFAFEMSDRFSDGKPHDALVASLSRPWAFPTPAPPTRIA